MPLEHRLESELPLEPLSPLRNQEAREAANGWLSRLSPLLERTAPSQVAECRKRVAQVEALRPDGVQALAGLQQEASQKDVTLLQTLEQALGELGGIESDRARRLATVAPGDPDGEVDLEVMRTKLADAAARREVSQIGGPLGVTQETGPLPPLVLPVSDPEWLQALILGTFSVFWTAIGVFQAVVFVGTMYLVFGPWALALLLFFSFFALIDLAVIAAALYYASTEVLTLNGSEMTLTRKLGPLRWNRKYQLGPESKVYVDSRNVSYGRRGCNGGLAVRDVNEKLVRFASGRPRPEQPGLRDQINAYLGRTRVNGSLGPV